MPSPGAEAVIAGIGEPPVGRLIGSNPTELHVEAAMLAIEDAGIDKHDIDGLMTSGTFLNDNIRHHMIIGEHLGIHCKSFVDTLRTGGQSYLNGLQIAKWAVESGQCKAVLMLRGDNILSGVPKGTGLKAYIEYGAHPIEFEVPYGITVPGVYAMVAQRHMHEFGTTPEQLAAIAVACRKHASLNPAAFKRDPITVDDVINSPLVSTPLHLLDCSPICDGAGAILVTSLERARDLKAKPVRILGTGQAQSYYHLAHLARATGARAEDKARFGLTRTVQSVAAEQAFGRAGVKPSDIDVAELYDSFTITALLQFEDLGYCAKGEGGAFAENGRIELGGELPINTHGGLLSFGSSGGINHIIEAARQMRGEGGDRQVPNAQLALATNVSAVASNHSIAILGRD
ncbi:MAG TPA: thiolase family protein [Devosia sp.]|nr:thiolase family protein [Devosia sp.]